VTASGHSAFRRSYKSVAPSHFVPLPVNPLSGAVTRAAASLGSWDALKTPRYLAVGAMPAPRCCRARRGPAACFSASRAANEPAAAQLSNQKTTRGA
jgi:hypothetical protein